MLDLRDHTTQDLLRLAVNPASGHTVEQLMEGQKLLSVLAEPAMQNWLYEYAAIEDYGYSRIAPLTLSARLLGV